MNTVRNQIRALLCLAGGILLSVGGVLGGYSLYSASHSYEHTVGIVRRFHTEKVHRYRKIRYRHEMCLMYPTVRYGEMSVSKNSYWPFRNVGDSLSVWYHPDHPHDIRLPESEGVLWGGLLVSGVLCICVGVLVWRRS